MQHTSPEETPKVRAVEKVCKLSSTKENTFVHPVDSEKRKKSSKGIATPREVEKEAKRKIIELGTGNEESTSSKKKAFR